MIQNTTVNFLQSLVKLGLTKDESKCYTALWEEGSLNASSIARKMQVLPNAVYRLMNSLQEKGFIISLNTSPKTFQAIPPSVAIDSFYESKKKELEKTKTELIINLTAKTQLAPKTRIDILTGRNATYSKFIELADQTKEELLIISIGEPVPDEIKLVAVRAKERGVTQRYIFHRYGKDNEQLLKSWIKMGIEVRHYQDAGYHLMIFDEKKCILVSSNPENTEERTGMLIYSENLTKALRNYFYSLWEKAIEIK